MSCTTCGCLLREEKSPPVTITRPVGPLTSIAEDRVESGIGTGSGIQPDSDQNQNPDPESSNATDPKAAAPDSNSNLTSSTSTSTPKGHFLAFDFDQKFMVDPVKFCTAVTYFLPAGVTPEIQDAISNYQLPFCTECIDIIDRIYNIESEIDNLYRLVDSLIACFKFKIQVTFNNEPLGQGQGQDQGEEKEKETREKEKFDTQHTDESIWKLRASLIGLKSWNGLSLRTEPKPDRVVKFQMPPTKSKLKSSNIIKEKRPRGRPPNSHKKTLSQQQGNKKRQNRESVIKKAQKTSKNDSPKQNEGEEGDEGENETATTTMHYDYLAISSDSNSTVELNPSNSNAKKEKVKVKSESGELVPDGPTENPVSEKLEETEASNTTETQQIQPRKSARIVNKKNAIADKSSTSCSPSKKAKTSKFNEEEFETNLDDIISDDENQEEMGEEEEDDKEWNENDELETDVEDEEEEEDDDFEYFEDPDDSGADEDFGEEEGQIRMEQDQDEDNDNDNDKDTNINSKIVRFQKFRETKLKLKKELKGKMPGEKISKKCSVTDVGGGTFEYKNCVFSKRDEDKFQCNACNKIFKARGNVIAHINLKHVPPRPCLGSSNPNSKGKVAPKRKTDRRQRQVIQLEPGVFKFEDKTFSLREDGRYQCGSCPNTLKTRDSVLVHIKQRHLGEGLGKFLCHQCGKSFDRDVYLKLHEISHSANKKLHQCSTCGKTFTQVSNLYNHRKIHTGELNHHCDFEGCGKKFLTRKQLTVHMKRHLGDRPYECDLCPKKFVRSSELVIHMRSHSEERPYECRLCESKFFIKYRLNRHLKRVHHIDEPVMIVESGDAPIRIITTSIHNNTGTTTTAQIAAASATTTTQIPLSVTTVIDPQNPLHHFLTLNDLF